MRLTVILTLTLCLTVPALAQNNAGTPAESLDTLPGFKVERILSADKAAHGSWISMGLDHKGRLLLGGALHRAEHPPQLRLLPGRP